MHVPCETNIHPLSQYKMIKAPFAPWGKKNGISQYSDIQVNEERGAYTFFFDKRDVQKGIEIFNIFFRETKSKQQGGPGPDIKVTIQAEINVFLVCNFFYLNIQTKHQRQINKKKRK